MLILYILRHGLAKPEKSTRSDEDRTLTQEGKRTLRRVLTLARDAFSTELDQIAASPYTRAIQTAEIAKEILTPTKPDLVVEDSLAPVSSLYEVYKFLANQNFTPMDRLLLISHQPIAGQLISDLIGSDSNIRLSPGSMARVDVKGEPLSRGGTLVWLVPSDVLF